MTEMTSAGPRSPLKVAVVHEWLTNRAGSERCVEALLEAFPDHRLYTSLHQPDLFPAIAPERVHASAIQPLFDRPHGHLRAAPLLPFAMRSLRIDEPVDAAVYSFHHFATQVRAPLDLPTLAYVYTPPRFIHRAGSLRDEPGRLARLALGVAHGLAGVDRRLLRRRATELVAISDAVAQRCRQAYGVSPRVIHPPVDVERLAARVRRDSDDFFLMVGRLVPYKRPDLAIDAFAAMGDLRLKVVGDGRLADALAASAPPNVELVGHVTDDELHQLYGRARGALLPAEEDFGIVPVEAMAAGCPVVAYGAGGALDYIEPGRNGFTFPDPTAASLQAAVRQLLAADLDRHDVAASAQRFRRARFQAEVIEVVESLVAAGAGRLAARPGPRP